MTTMADYGLHSISRFIGSNSSSQSGIMVIVHYLVNELCMKLEMLKVVCHRNSLELLTFC